MIEHTFEQLRNLRLGGMIHALQQQQAQPATYEELSFEERLTLLIDREYQSREDRKQERLIKAARFRLAANLQQIDYQHPRGLQRSMIASLAQNDWIRKGRNLLITGPCGCGKTWIACALGHNACLQGYGVHYYRLSRLLIELTQAKADGSWRKQLQQLAKTSLLIIDDWGLEPLTTAHRNDLMEIMDDRYGQTSTLIISQLPTDQWHQAIGDNTLADAILDRLMHNTHRIQLNGESMRKRHVISKNENRGTVTKNTQIEIDSI